MSVQPDTDDLSRTERVLSREERNGASAALLPHPRASSASFPREESPPASSSLARRRSLADEWTRRVQCSRRGGWRRRRCRSGTSIFHPSRAGWWGTSARGRRQSHTGGRRAPCELTAAESFSRYVTMTTTRWWTNRWTEGGGVVHCPPSFSSRRRMSSRDVSEGETSVHCAHPTIHILHASREVERPGDVCSHPKGFRGPT